MSGIEGSETSSFFYAQGGSGYLSGDSECLPMPLFLRLHDWNVHLQNEGREMLHVLDEAADTGDNNWSVLVRGTVELVEELMEWFQNFMHQLFDRHFLARNAEDMLFYYRSWAFGARLAFYIGRLYKWSPIEIENQLEAMSYFCDEPITSALALLELRDAEQIHYEHVYRINEALEELQPEADTPVDLDDIARPFTLEMVPHPLELCPICRFQADVSTGIILRKCGHVFCMDCIGGWINACQPNSHCCPYCRQEMLPKPIYRAADIAREIDLRHMLLRAQDRALSLSGAIDSLVALEVEVRRLSPVIHVPRSLITGTMSYGTVPVEDDDAVSNARWALGNE